MSERQTVSYFENQFHSTAIMEPDKFFDEHGAEHMIDIWQGDFDGEVRRGGFDEVIFCVTELDMRLKARRRLLANLTKTAEDQGLLVTADPWRLGGVFGGEGMSFYEQDGGKPCICEPELEDLLLRWIDTVAEAGITRVFWDEPELDCADHNRSLELIDRFSQEAVARGITWNGSCIRSRDPGIDLSDDIASMVAINEIAVAPYQFHPQNPTQKTRLEVIDSIAPWFERIRSAADRHDIDAQAWFQGFNISRQNLPIIETCADEIKNARIGNMAVWGYRACEIVTHLNPPSAEPPEVVWAEVRRVMAASR